MKKSAKPTIFLLLSVLTIITFFVLASVGLKLKYEQMLLQKDNYLKALKTEEERNTKLIAEYQNQTDEERIVSIAETELKLIRNSEPAAILRIDKIKIEKINGVLKEKYE